MIIYHAQNNACEIIMKKNNKNYITNEKELFVFSDQHFNL